PQDGGGEAVGGAVLGVWVGGGRAGQDQQQVGAGVGEQHGSGTRLLLRPASLQVVGSRVGNRQRELGGPRRPHRVQHLERVAHPVPEAAAELVLPVVGQRGDVGREKSALRKIEQQQPLSELACPPGGRHEAGA